MKSHLYLYEITRYLTAFVVQVKLENQSGRFDINKHAERFLVPIFNELFSKTFERLEYSKANYPAVDLRSIDKTISIQVTSETGFDKIRETLSRFISNKLYESSRLIHFVISEDYTTRKTDADITHVIEGEFAKMQISPAPAIQFSSADIWNVARLNKEIEQHCSVDQLKKIRDFLKSEYGDVTQLPTFNDILIPYEIAFESQLKATTGNLPFLFNNPFFGRDADLNKLTQFMSDPKDAAIMVVADGGYGKTRLCIEFFGKVMSSGSAEAFVLNDQAFQGHLSLTGQLLTKPVLILVDDAHRKAELLESLVIAAKQYSNVKLICTVRKALHEDTLKALPTHLRSISSLHLKRLSYDETLSLIQSQLPGLNEISRKRIAQESKGVPIVILGLCQTIREGKYSAEISEEENFRRFVRELKDQAISDIAAKYYAEKSQINKTIELISLLGPIKNDEVEIRLLAQLTGISYEDTSLILSYLEEHEFIYKKEIISILSDPYSDIVLLEMAQRINFVLQQKGIERFTDRIIRNIVAVEHSDRLRLDVNAIILEFINSISKNKLNDHSDVQAFDNNLDTLKHFAYKKPQLILNALQVILKLAEGNIDFWQMEPFSKFRETHNHLDTIISIVALNSHGDRELNAVTQVIQEFISRRQDFNILIKSFRYREYDFPEYRYEPQVPCERQQFLAKKVQEMSSNESLSESDAQYILTAASTLLKLEFSIEESFDKYKHTISYGTAQVVDNEITKNIRDTATTSLINLFNKAHNNDIADKCYQVLLRMLHFMTVPDRKNKYELNQSSQVKLAVTFFTELIHNKPSVQQKSQLNRQLQIYSRREIREEYKQTWTDLLSAANSSANLREKIELLLRDEYFHKKKNLNEDLKAILLEYPEWQSFYRDAIDVKRNLSGQDANHIYDLFNYLIQHHPDRCKEMYAFVIREAPDLRTDFCELIRANYKDKRYFYQCVEELWALQTEIAWQCVIFLLTVGRNRDRTQYEIRDLNYIESALDAGNIGAMFRLSVTLPDYLELDPDKTLWLCEKLFKQDKRAHETEMLIHSIFERDGDPDPLKEKLKQFAFDKTLSLSINSHYQNQILNFLDKNYGFDVMFAYLLKKLSFYEANDKVHLIDFSNLHGRPELTQEDREDRLLKAIQWYASQDDPSPYVHAKLIETFATPGVFSQAFKDKMQLLATKHQQDYAYLIKVCQALDAFENKDGELLNFLIFVANKIVNLPGYNADTLITVFGSDFVYNGGGKSKSGPGPFPQDVARREQLAELVKRSDLHKEVVEVFNLALRIVNDAIEKETRAENDEW
jgi:hypothetical protein